MSEVTPELAPRGAATVWRPVRLDTLTGLRWLAVAGQFSAIIVVAFLLDYPLPLVASLAVIGTSAALNIHLTWRYGAAFRLTNRFAAGLLAFDLVQLSSLLWLTGGLNNPFSLLLLAPISVSATSLNQRATLALSLLTGGLITLLAVWHLPLPWAADAPIGFNDVYVAGIWAALLLGVAFVAAYTNRVAYEARKLTAALSATELALSRQQQLRALDGLAAAAAHELGTPLSTIALAAKDMQTDLGDSPFAEDAGLIVDQVARCRAILGKLRSLGTEGGDPFAEVTLGDLIAEVTRPYEQLGKTILYEAVPLGGADPVLRRAVGLLYGLGNLVENSVHFARSMVTIVAHWDDAEVRLTITDDGSGFPPELITHLGEPYLTTRPREQHADDPTARGGLGLGIFISKTLLERTGATIVFSNAHPQGHARVEIIWSRNSLADWDAQN